MSNDDIGAIIFFGVVLLIAIDNRIQLHKKREIIKNHDAEIKFLQDQIQRYRNELDWESSEKKLRVETETGDTSNEL